MNKMLIVVRETYLRQIRSWAFVTMILAPLFFILLTGFIGYISGKSAAENLKGKIAFIQQEDDLKDQIQEFAELTTKYKDEATAKKAMKEKKLIGYLTVQVVDGQVLATYRGQEGMDAGIKSQLGHLLTAYQNQLNLAAANLSEEQLAKMSQTVRFEETIDENKELDRLTKYIAVSAIVFTFYFIVLIYASSTSQEIASEKGTKIMEIIFSSIPAPLYFYGRLLGIFAVIVTHIVIYILVALATLPIARQFDGLKTFLDKIQPLVSGVFGHITPTVILFVLFGLFIYVALSALCGSLVTRAEEANKAVQPVIMPVIFAFIVAQMLGPDGNHPIIKIGSYIPLLSSFFMPIREINANAGTWEIWLSLAILAATTIALVYYIGRSYAGLILQKDDLGLWKNFKKGITSR